MDVWFLDMAAGQNMKSELVLVMPIDEQIKRRVPGGFSEDTNGLKKSGCQSLIMQAASTRHRCLIPDSAPPFCNTKHVIMPSFPFQPRYGYTIIAGSVHL